MTEVLHRIRTTKAGAAAIPYRLSGSKAGFYDFEATRDTEYPEIWWVTFLGPQDDLEALRPDILPPKR